MLETIRSLPHPDALAQVVRGTYGLPADRCVLVRSLTNDVYEVTADGRRFALKVYGAGGWSIDEVRWEQGLALHLADRGVPVAAVVAPTDGGVVGVLDAPEGPRPYALTAYVDGVKPQPPYDDDLYHAFGALTARFHAAADTFTTDLPRRPLDLSTTLERPLAAVLPRLAERPDDQRRVRELGEAAGRRVAELAGHGLTWGIRHGDVTLDNLHRIPGGLVLHDFDLAAPGWRAADLTGVWAFDHWEAFRAGYERVRTIRAVDLEALPWLGVIERVANLAFHLVDKPAIHGTESLSEGWVDRELDGLRETERTLG
jgi:Ser/Thr protein kinase RdoA (MazF antagonist)